MKRVLLGLILLLAADAAQADDAPSSKRAYLASVGVSRSSDRESLSGVEGLDLGGGVELYATDPLRLSFKLNVHVFRTDPGTTHLSAGLFSLRIIPFPTTWMVRPYLDAGFGYVTSTASETLPSGTEVGAGVEWKLGGQDTFLGITGVYGESSLRTVRFGVRIP